MGYWRRHPLIGTVAAVFIAALVFDYVMAMVLIVRLALGHPLQ